MVTSVYMMVTSVYMLLAITVVVHNYQPLFIKNKFLFLLYHCTSNKLLGCLHFKEFTNFSR